jgi:hypothetical protein
MNRRDERWGSNGEEQEWQRRSGRGSYESYGDERRGQRHGVGRTGYGGGDPYGEGGGQGGQGYGRGGFESERHESPWRSHEHEGGGYGSRGGGGEGWGDREGWQGGRYEREMGGGGRGYGYAEERPRRGGHSDQRGWQEQGSMGGSFGGRYGGGQQYGSEWDAPSQGDWQGGRQHSSMGGDFGRQGGFGEGSRYGHQGGYGQGQGGHSGEHGGWNQQTTIPQGPFAGKGPRGYKRSPDRLKEQVCDLLEQHGEIDASDIDVKVEDDGTVTLSGSVDSRRAKRLAEDLAESVTGIRDVQNQLKVQSDRMSMSESHGSTSGGGAGSGSGRSTQEGTRETASAGGGRSGTSGSKTGL